MSSLGDVLLCAPALRALRRRFPEAQIDFLVATTFVEAAQLLPEVNNIITFDRAEGWRGLLRLRHSLSRRYELIVDLQNSWRSAFLRTFCIPLMWTKAKRHRFNRWLLITFKWDLYRERTPVPLRYLKALENLGASDDELGLELRKPLVERNSKLIVLAPGAKHFTKRWAKENWMELASALRNAGWQVAVCGTSAEADLCRALAGNGLLLLNAPLADVSSLLGQASAIVSHDSGLMHLASGVGTPLVAIFGPTVEQFGFYPYRAQAEVVEQKLPCRPCSAFGGDVCPKRHHDCMRKTTVQDVVNAITRLVERSQ